MSELLELLHGDAPSQTMCAMVFHSGRNRRPFTVRKEVDLWKRSHLHTGRFVDRIEEKSRLGRDQIGRLVMIVTLAGGRHVYYCGPDAVERVESGRYDPGQHVMVFVRSRPVINGETYMLADDVVLCDRHGALAV